MASTSATAAASRPPAAKRARPSATRRAGAAEPPAKLTKRAEALNKGIEAIVEFVDGPARRAGATACADALLLAVPRAERGPRVSHFLRAAGAKEPPARLQELAEAAGMELVVALKAVSAELRAREAR
ncbi:MAG TPA: hypothetical protein VIN56_07745 [Candidatus Dormibacteraeota bacterium]